MFIDKVIKVIDDLKSPMAIGLDPDLNKISSDFLQQFSMKEYDDFYHYLGSIYEHYCKEIIKAAEGICGILKFQIAFFEVAGHYGIQTLRNCIIEAKKRNFLVILDFKRADVASTSKQYAMSCFREPYQGVKPYLESDCVTLNPFLGIEGISPFLEEVNKAKKGAFICLKTSNKGSKELQDLTIEKTKEPLYLYLLSLVKEASQASLGSYGYSSLGVVVGATFPQDALKIRKRLPKSYFLVPGFGAQGGDFNRLKDYLNKDGKGAIFSFSRSIIYPEIKGFNEKVSIKELIQRNILEHLKLIRKSIRIN